LSSAPVDIAQALLADWLLVQDPLLIERYNRALDLVSSCQTALSRFHIDAHGFSPEIAQELKNPNYLGHGPDHPFAIILSIDQLDRPVIQPNAGFALGGLALLGELATKELAILTLDDVVIIEFAHPLTRVHRPGALGAIKEFTLQVDTPSQRVSQAVELERLGVELLDSASLWHDESHIAKMLELAGNVRRLTKNASSITGIRCRVGSFYHPGFSGTYLFRGVPSCPFDTTVFSLSETHRAAPPHDFTHVLLNPSNVIEFLKIHELADFGAWKPDGATGECLIDRKIHWLSALALLSFDPDLDPADLDTKAVERALRSSHQLPRDVIQLEEARGHLQAGGKVHDLGHLSEKNVLRLLTPLPSSMESTVAHLLATMDPIDVETLYRVAPDRFFATMTQRDPRCHAVLTHRLGAGRSAH